MCACAADLPYVTSAKDMGRILYPLTSHLRLPTLCLLQEVLGTIGTLFGGSVVLTDLRHTTTVGPAIVDALRLGARLVRDHGAAVPSPPPGQVVLSADCYDLWLHGARAMGALWRVFHIKPPLCAKKTLKDLPQGDLWDMCGVTAWDSLGQSIDAAGCKSNFVALAPAAAAPPHSGVAPKVADVTKFLLFGDVRGSASVRT